MPSETCLIRAVGPQCSVVTTGLRRVSTPKYRTRLLSGGRGGVVLSHSHAPSTAVRYCGREVRSYLCARGAYHITLLHQRVERPGLDGLIKQKISDQTVQVWLTRCQRGKSYVVRPARKKYDLTSLPQYCTSAELCGLSLIHISSPRDNR